MGREDNKVPRSVVLDTQSRKGSFTAEDLKIVSQAAQFGVYDDSEEIVEEVTEHPVIEDTVQQDETIVSEQTPQTQNEAQEIAEITLQHEQLVEQMRVEKEESERTLRAEIEALQNTNSEPVKPVERYDAVAEIESLNRDDYGTEYDFIKAQQELTLKLLRTQSVQDPRLDAILP